MNTNRKVGQFILVETKEKPKVGDIVKLRKDGTAIIHPYKESVEEAAKRLSDYKHHSVRSQHYAFIKGFKACAEWQKNQKK